MKNQICQVILCFFDHDSKYTFLRHVSLPYNYKHSFVWTVQF